MTSAAAGHIPAELWLDIWLQLDFTDRVSASRTCSQWRAIALESQDLWREVHVHAPLFITSCPMHKHAPCMPIALPLLLDRSGQSTITLFLSECGSVEDMDDLLKTLSPHLHRVAGLKLYYSTVSCINVVLPAASVWPVLRMLETRFLESIAEGESSWRCSHGRRRSKFTNIRLPALECVSFTADQWITEPSLSCLPPTLKHLTIEINGVKELVSVLEQCPNLTRLRVGFWGSDSDAEDGRYRSEDARVLELAGRIPEVILAVIGYETEARAIQLFPALSTRRSMHLVYRCNSNRPLPRQIFDELHSALSVTLSLIDFPGTAATLSIVISVVDMCGAERKITFVEGHTRPAVLFSALWLLLEGRIEQLKVPPALLNQATETLDAETIKRVVVSA